MSETKSTEIDLALARVRAWAAENSLKPTRFAKEAGLHPNTLRNLWSPDWSPSVETLRKLERIVPKDWKPGESPGKAA